MKLTHPRQVTNYEAGVYRTLKKVVIFATREVMASGAEFD